MNILQMLMQFWNIQWKLQQLWVSPSDLQWVNFSDPNSLEELAKKIMPWLLKNNPQVAQQIKQIAPQYAPDKANDIVQIIEQ